MKIVIVLAIAFVAVQGTYEDDMKNVHFPPIINEEWEKFKVKFNRTYPSPDVELVRKLIFMDDAYKIADHNKLYAEGKLSWAAGFNRFADMTGHEVPLGIPLPHRDDNLIKYLHVKPHNK